MFTTLLQKTVSVKKRLTLSFAFVSFFYVLCNGYRMFRQAFAGDALLMVHQNDAAWQIALGRFFQPILILCRGGLETPLLISMLAILWLSLSVYFFCDLFGLDTVLSHIFMAALFGCNLSLIVANASFLPWVDFYALALFLAVCPVWLLHRGGLPRTLFAILLLALSLGIYQSYICVTIGMLMLLCLRLFASGDRFIALCKKTLHYLLSLAAAFLLYFLIWKLFQRIFHIWTSDSYNGLSSVGNYAGQSVPALFAATYRHVWDFLWNPEVYVTMSFREVSLSIVILWVLRICNLFVLLMLLRSFIVRVRNASALNLAVCCLLLLLFPFGINFVCFLSKNMEHSLMIYAFCLIYAAVPVLHATDTDPGRAVSPGPSADQKEKKASPGNTSHIRGICFLFAVSAVVWTDIVFANQLYLKRELQEEAALSLMTRIVYEIEHTPGYEAGVTPVAFSGSFETTSYTDNPNEFSDLHPWGVGRTSMTYGGTDYAYLKYVMNVHMNLTRIDAAEIRDLPVYPAEGSVDFVGDTLVVKISDL